MWVGGAERKVSMVAATKIIEDVVKSEAMLVEQCESAYGVTKASGQVQQPLA